MSTIQTWNASWVGPRLTAPDGSLRSPVFGDRPEVITAHECVDCWGRALQLEAGLPRVGKISPWWTARFKIQTQYLTGLLPYARLLSEIRRELQRLPSRIDVRGAPYSWAPALFAVIFPESRIVAHRHQSRGPKEQDLAWWAARARRAWATARRLPRLRAPDPRRPRILVLSRDRLWDGRRNLELQSAIQALMQAGMEIVELSVSAQSHAGERLRALRSRPADHVFDDYLLFHHLLRHAPPRTPAMDIPRRGYVLEGLDVSPIFAPAIRRFAAQARRQMAVYSRAVPSFVQRIGARGALLADENGGSYALQIGLRQSSIPVIAVQHGVIHEHHLAYMFPPGTAPDAIPLCDKTCVYGPRIKRLLTEKSVYPPDSVVVAGQTQNDARGAGARARGARSPEAEQRRRAILPPGCDQLLLFTSQHLYCAALAPRLLDALAKSRPRRFLLVRPHPLERDPRTFWSGAFAAHGVKARAALQSEGTLDDALDMCDVHLSGTSTVLGEALIFGRPNIIIGARQFGDFMGVLEAGAAVELENFPSLDAAVEACLDDSAEAVERWEGRRRRYIEENFHQIDGRAGERIAQVVEDAIAGRRGSVG